MTVLKPFPKSSRRILMLTTALLLITPAAAFAKDGGHSKDHAGPQKSGFVPRDKIPLKAIGHSSHHDGDHGAKSSMGNKDRGKDKPTRVLEYVKAQRPGDEHKMNHEDKHAKHEGKDKEFADKHDDKMRRTATATGSIKKIPVEMTGIHKDKDRSNGTTASNAKKKGKGDTTAATNGTTAALPGSAGNNTIHPIINNTPAGSTPPAGGDVTVSNGVTTTVLHGASSGVVVQTLEPGKITVRDDNGQSVTLPGGSVNVSGAAIVSPGVRIDRADHPDGVVTLAVRPGMNDPTPAAPPAPPVPGHVTGGPEGGFFGDLGSSIVDAGKAIGRGAVDVISIGGPTPGTPGAGEPKTSTSSQQ